MATITPYLLFNGNAEEAFNFYRSAFGGKFSELQRFKDVPPEAAQGLTKQEGEKLIHVALPIKDGIVLLGGDAPKSKGPVQFGNNVSICINAESEKEAKTFFDKLSKGGKVIMPLTKTFFSPSYGMFIDKFGIYWMIIYMDPKARME